MSDLAPSVLGRDHHDYSHSGARLIILAGAPPRRRAFPVPADPAPSGAIPPNRGWLPLTPPAC
ncbi:MAG TPA: hypothetical protein VIL18_02905, partial [Longimicrobiales bacterium]